MYTNENVCKFNVYRFILLSQDFSTRAVFTNSMHCIYKGTKMHTDSVFPDNDIDLLQINYPQDSSLIVLGLVQEENLNL